MRLPVQLIESFDDAQLNFEALQGDANWSVPALINSWVYYGSGGYETVGFRKNGFREVRLKGSLKSGSNGTVAFVLPPGYIPGATGQYAAASASQDGAVVVIDTSGNVSPFGTGVGTYVSLAGITFLAEN